MGFFRQSLLAGLGGVALFLSLVRLPAFAATESGHSAPKATAKKTPLDARKNSATASQNSCLGCVERRAVLDPSLFARGYDSKVKPAYEAARQDPDLLDRLHCFCECQESPKERHKTLLTCFTDTHAAGCGICINEALLAVRLKSGGASDEEIEATVERLHRTDGHRPTHGRGL